MYSSKLVISLPIVIKLVKLLAPQCVFQENKVVTELIFHLCKPTFRNNPIASTKNYMLQQFKPGFESLNWPSTSEVMDTRQMLLTQTQNQKCFYSANNALKDRCKRQY